MNENYDVIILGTGLKECILSGLLSVSGKKVLHMDSNEYYGSECASFNLEKLYEKFKNNSKPNKNLGDYRNYIVDLCPKFLMACGNLVKMLIHTKVTRYLDFNVVEGSYVYKDEKLFKMPSTPAEALGTNLMGFFQKRKYKNFLQFVIDFDETKPGTMKNLKPTMQETFDFFGLDRNSVISLGNALALQLDESYLNNPTQKIKIIKAIKLYYYSVTRYGKSPFIYPIYSLSGLPESFARLSAVYGGVYMLNKKIDKILYDEKGNVRGVRSEGEEAFCKQLIAEPSYFKPGDSALKKKIARWIFILRHPLKFAESASSCQAILPGCLVNHKANIYIAVVSSEHKVCPEGIFLAMISTEVETNDPKKEMAPARALLGDVEDDFFFTTNYFEPNPEFSSKKDNTFMTSSYDATTHFESVSDEVLRLYKEISGKEFDLNISAEPEDVTNLE